MPDERLVMVAIPPLVGILLHREKQKGVPLNEKEVLDIRDHAVCVAMPHSAAAQLAEKRGYDDIRPEHAWEDWSAIRPSLGLQP